MDCLVLPVSILTRGCSGTSRLGYEELTDEEDGSLFVERQMVTVVVGKEKREFLVDPFVLEETPFRALIGSDSARRMKKKNKKKVVFVNVDAILFEHMLWLMHNDCSSLFELNLEEIINFYAQDI